MFKRYGVFQYLSEVCFISANIADPDEMYTLVTDIQVNVYIGNMLSRLSFQN